MHHIIPKCFNGDNSNQNLISLTAREHFVCHLLLTKMVLGQDKMKMIHAAFGMNNMNNHKINSHVYESLRKAISTNMKNNPMFNEEIRKKESNTLKTKPKRISNYTHSDETKRKMSQKAKGRVPWNKGLKGVCKGNPGLIHSVETRKRIGEKIRLRNLGSTHSEETKKKMSEAKKLYWVKKRKYDND